MRIKVTDTTFFERPAAEKRISPVYSPGPNAPVCGVRVVEVPLAPLVGCRSNQEALSKLCQVAPLDVVTWML